MRFVMHDAQTFLHVNACKKEKPRHLAMFFKSGRFIGRFPHFFVVSSRA